MHALRVSCTVIGLLVLTQHFASAVDCDEAPTPANSGDTPQRPAVTQTAESGPEDLLVDAWFVDLDRARQQALQAGKPIMIVFR